MNIISGIKSVLCSALTLSIVAVAGTAAAQDHKVVGSGSGNNNIVYVENNATNTQDRVAVYGKSTPAAYYGIGGQFEGGYHGVRGYAQVTGTGSRTGGYFLASNGASSSYGVYTNAYGPSGSTNYGIYSSVGSTAGSTNYAGYFSGNVVVTGTFSNPSDLRLKMNVQDLSGSLGLILKLRPKTYQFKTSEFSGMGLPKGDQIGLIAQDVQAVIPQVVQEVAVPTEPSKDGVSVASQPAKILSIDYMKLIPVLVKAIQEQQAQIDDLKAQLGKK